MKAAAAALVLLFVAITASPQVQGPPGVPVLQQQGTISGTLLTRDGKPAAGVRVGALEIREAGVNSDQSVMSLAETDQNGRYRLEQVPPGRYRITAGALDTPTYFPGVAGVSGATIVTVAPMANVTGIDFRLAVAQALRFSGKIIRQDNTGQTVGAPATAARPVTQIRLQGQGVPVVMAAVGADGSFEFTNVRPGTYRVIPNPQPLRMPQVTVTLVDVDITGYELIVPLMVQISGSVTVEDDGPTPRFQLTFSNARDPAPTGQTASNAQATVMAQAGPRFNIEVPAGANRITPGALPAGFTIKSMTSGGVDLSAASLNVGAAGAPPIEIVLAVADPPPWVRVTGRIVGRGVPGVTRINVSGQAVATQLPVVLYMDGSFEIAKALPGLYSTGNSQLNVPADAAEMTGAIISVLAADTDANAARLPLGAASSAARVRGRIVGRALAATPVRIRITDAVNGESRHAAVFMDGSFEFSDVQAGTYTAEVVPSIPGASPTALRVSSADILDFEVVVPATREIAGRVLVEDGARMPHSLTLAAGSARIPVTMPSSGAFRVIAPAGAPLTVVPDSLPQGTAVRSIQFGDVDRQTDLRVTLISTRGVAAVSGRVTGLGTEFSGISFTAALSEYLRRLKSSVEGPATDDSARVWLMDPEGKRHTLETPVAGDGAFRFDNVEAGDYIAALAAPGLPATAMAAPITVTAGKNVTNLEFAAPRAVSGRVTVDGGGVPPRFGLRLISGASSEITIAIHPEPNGSFMVFLPVGEHRIGSAVGLPDGKAIQSLRYGAADLAREPLRISADGGAELSIQIK
jgi:5-hydroxyisourate hydrolase-like protein (transthyretin family)